MEGQAYLQHWPLIREILEEHIDSSKVRYSYHADKRMEERGITKAMVEFILYHNDPKEMHEAQHYPFGEQPYTNADPVLTIVGDYNDRKLAVGLAVKRRNRGVLFTVVTAMFPEHGRHVR